MRRIVFVSVVSTVLWLSACAPPSVARNATGRTSDCADRFAHALTSPLVPVPGAFACLTADQQTIARGAGITNDAGFQAYAASDPKMDHYMRVGVRQNGDIIYDLSGSGYVQMIELHLNAQGLIDNMSFFQTEKL